MDCSCQIDTGYDADSNPGFVHERMRKARKTHKCSECHRVIAINEIYVYVTGVWDGEFSSFKTCVDCASLRNEFFSSYIFEHVWEDFKEYVSECDGNIPEKCLLKLTNTARAKVVDIMETYFEKKKGVL